MLQGPFHPFRLALAGSPILLDDGAAHQRAHPCTSCYVHGVQTLGRGSPCLGEGEVQLLHSFLHAVSMTCFQSDLLASLRSPAQCEP